MFVFHPGVHVPLRRRDRSLPKKKRYVYPPVPVNLSLLQAWRIAWTGKNEPPLFGRIRLLAPFTGPEFLRIPLYCQDRTISEWNTTTTLPFRRPIQSIFSLEGNRGTITNRILSSNEIALVGTKMGATCAHTYL